MLLSSMLTNNLFSVSSLYYVGQYDAKLILQTFPLPIVMDGVRWRSHAVRQTVRHKG